MTVSISQYRSARKGIFVIVKQRWVEIMPFEAIAENALFLPPANEVCEGYVFTPVCQSFCSQGGGGVCRSACWDKHQNSWSRHPLPRSRHPLPKATTLLGIANPQEQTPWSRHPPEQTPLLEQTPPAQCML